MKKKLISLALTFAMTAMCVPTLASAEGGSDNIALGKTVVASGYYSWDFNHSRINDGNISTTASTGSVPVDGPRDGMKDYIGVDLGEKYKLDKVIVRTRRDMKDAWCRIIDGVYVATRDDFTDAVKIGEKKVAGDYGSDLEIDLSDSETVGRYVYISSGAYGELEVYGDKYVPVMEGEFEDVSDKYTNAVRIVTKLGIMSGVKNGVFGSDNLVTRGEAAAAANNVMGGAKSKYNGEFSDVSPEHEYADDIASALSCGLISKDDTFRPNDYITSYELFAILMRASGFYAMSEDGAWYNDVLTLANAYGLSDGVDLSNGYINRADMAMAIYNLLMGGYIKIDWNDNSYKMSENSFIKDKFRMELRKGIVTANAVTSLTAGDYSTEGYIKIGDEKFTLDDPAKGNGLLGKAVYCLVNDDDELVDVWEDVKKNSVVELKSKDIDSTSQTNIKTAVNNKVTNYKIDSNAYYLKNGVAFANVDYSKMAPKYGSIRLIDNDGDNVYEVVELREPTIIALTSVSWDEDTKKISVSGKNNYKETFNYKFAYSYSSGVRSDLSAVKAGKLAYAYVSEDKQYIEFYMQSGGVSGVVSRFSEDTIVIDSEEYEVSEYFKDNYLSDITLGATYSFLLNDDGELAAITDESTRIVGEKLAIVVKCYDDTDSQKVNFKLYTEDNMFLNLVTSEKCKADGKSLSADTFANFGAEYFVGKPVIIQANDNSEITSILTPASERLKQREESLNGTHAAKAGFYSGMNLVLPACHDTVSFRIPTNESGMPKTDASYSSNYSVQMLDKRYTLNRDGITSSEKITLFGSDDNGLPIAAITTVSYPDLSGYGAISVYNNRTSIVVENVYRAANSDGDAQYMISGWDVFTGAKVSFTTEPELTSVVNTFKAKNFDLYNEGSSPQDSWFKDSLLWEPDKVNEDYLEPITSLKSGDIIRYGILTGRTSANELEVVLKYDKLNEIKKNIPISAGDLPKTILSSYRMEYGHIIECSDGRVKMQMPDGTIENLALSDFEGGLLIFDGKYGEKHSFSEAENYMGSGETALIFSSAGFHQSIIVYK